MAPEELADGGRRQHLRRVYVWGNGKELGSHFVMCAIIGIDGVLPTTVSLPRSPWPGGVCEEMAVCIAAGCL